MARGDGRERASMDGIKPDGCCWLDSSNQTLKKLIRLEGSAICCHGALTLHSKSLPLPPLYICIPEMCYVMYYSLMVRACNHANCQLEYSSSLSKLCLKPSHLSCQILYYFITKMHTAYLDLLMVKKFGTEYNVAFYTGMDTIYITKNGFYPLPISFFLLDAAFCHN